MSLTEQKVHQIKPPPPPTLSKELLGVWGAWSRMNDREVVREAVAKGLHIEWAYTFLAARKSLELVKIEKWFKDEVYMWVDELLYRRQIFKATHILNNIKLDPLDEFSRIFLKTLDSSLRKYLGNHLEKWNRLEEVHKQAWSFLEIIKENSELLDVNCFNEALQELNVYIILNKSLEWKCKTGTCLFFNIFDYALTPFITAECAWNFLLKYENLDLLLSWIRVYFSKNINHCLVQEQLGSLFLTLKINDKMIDSIVDLNISVSFQNAIYNEISKFGIFAKHEQNNIEYILARISYSECLDQLYDILRNKNSIISINNFFDLVLNYCIENDLYIILNWCNINLDKNVKHNSRHMILMSFLKNSDYLIDKENVALNILYISKFLHKSEELEEYFNLNPLIPLSLLMLLCDNFDLISTFNSDKNKQFTLKNFTLNINVKNIFNLLPFLNVALQKLYPERVNYSLTYINLLKSYGNLNSNVNNFCFIGITIPDFNTSSFIDKYAYVKTVDYIFYLKQSCPSFASRVYYLKYDKLHEKKILKKLYKLVVFNFLNTEMMASCVAFLEMIGQHSHNFRIYIRSANILYKSGEFNFEQICSMLQNIKINSNAYLDALENVLMNKNFIFEHNSAHLIKEIVNYQIVVDFSRIFNLRLPSLFLINCAKNNLWLPFSIFVQMYKYPSEEVQKLILEFNNPSLIEHLYHSLLNDISIDDQKSLLMRDSRKYYLSRVGVRKSIDTSLMDGVHPSISSFGSYASRESSSGSSEYLETDCMESNTDLLQILIRCHNSIDPPKTLLQMCYVYRNPIFTILATSYEPDSIIINWLTWLSISCDINDKFSNFDNSTVTADVVKNVLKAVIEKCRNRTLLESLDIFLDNHPLIYFVRFLNGSADLNFDHDLAREVLTKFNKELENKKSFSISPGTDYDMMFLNNKFWIETTAIELFAISLHSNLNSSYDQLRYLKFISELDIDQYFSVPFPNFKKLLDVLNCLLEHNCDIRLNLSVIYDEEAITMNLLECTKELVLRKLHSCAFELTKIANLSSDFVLLSEWQSKFNEEHNLEFWDQCDYMFKNCNVEPHSAIEFFERCSQNAKDEIEKYHILNLAHRWVTFYGLSNLCDIERKVWLAYFRVSSKINGYDFIKMVPKKMLYSEMKKMLQDINTVENEELKNSCASEINKAIDKLLDHNDLWQSLRVSKMFGYTHTELEIIVLCCNLAEGFLMPYQLTTEQRLLLNKTHNIRGNRRRRTLVSSKGLSGSASYSHITSNVTMSVIDQVESPLQDTLVILETLYNRVKHGEEVIQNIFLMYRISLNMDKPYREVFLCKDPMFLLKQGLMGDCSNKLDVVHDFSVLFKWSKEKVAHLLCDELITTINDNLKSKTEPITLWNINLDVDFRLILHLLSDNFTILGLKLYKYADVLHRSQSQLNVDFKISQINLVIELLIRSHDCFTADCNMEGISSVLRKCQSIVALLLNLKSWKLIVRLLTGIARYSEMNYVFHILRENDQFEFLLRKGNRKDNGLKVALLQYLKECCPEERELYRMVALHFTLFSEIAQLWEEEAKSIVRNLIAISKLEMQNNGLNMESLPFVLLTNTDGTKICLNKAMINYTHATEYHLQGEKLTKAMFAAKQAELLALQLSLLKGLTSNATTVCLLNATESQIASLMTTELSFSQSLILVETYNYKTDWANVLFQQFVIKNSVTYLENFLNSFSLTDTLVYEISRKFINLKQFNDLTIKNMKEILNNCSSIYLKYRIASELGFSDLVEELLSGNELAYLKDTVWKKGYKC